MSLSIMKTINIQVYLPANDGLPDVEPPFKTLYFLPGFSNNAIQMGSILNLWLQSQNRGIAIVTTDADNSFYVDRPMRAYSQLIRELVDVTRKYFPLSTKREDTFLAGTSMGGFGAMYNGIRFAETFSKVALLSPGFDVYEVKDAATGAPAFPQEFLDSIFGSEENYHATDFDYRNALANAHKNHVALPEFFCCCGRQDSLVGDNVQKFRAYMTENKFPYIWAEAEGGHDMTFMENIFSEVFDFDKVQ